MEPIADLTTIYEIGLIVVLATVASKICVKLKLPGLIGAILVGLFLGGPGGIGLFNETDELKLFGTIGAILLLFMCGLQFDADMFFKMGKRIFLLTFIGVTFAIIAGFLIGLLIGWSAKASILLGVMISFSGTSILSAILLQKNIISTEEGTFIMTAAVTDDVIGIIIFSITVSSVRGETISIPEICLNAIFAILFVCGAIFLGNKALKKSIKKISKYLNDDELVLLFLGLGLIVAFIAASFFNLAAITGAFIVGAIIPRKEIGKDFGNRFNLMKDVFVTIFFTGIGVSLNPYHFGPVIPLAILVLGVAILSRLSGTLLGGYITKNKGKILWSAAFGLGIRGEMSLIIAQEGIAQNIVGEDFLILAFLVILGSIFISLPLFNRCIKSIEPRDIV